MRRCLSLMCRQGVPVSIIRWPWQSIRKSGQYKTVAVVGSDKLSAITDYKDRNTCVLFGDGAGAVILRRRAKEGIIRSYLGVNTNCGIPLCFAIMETMAVYSCG